MSIVREVSTVNHRQEPPESQHFGRPAPPTNSGSSTDAGTDRWPNVAPRSNTWATAWALVAIVALTLTACASPGTGTSDSQAALLPDSLPLSTEVAEVDRFISETVAEVQAGEISFDARFSRRCRQLEGVHSPVDPLIAELDRFYTDILSEDFGLAEQAPLQFIHSSPTDATVKSAKNDAQVDLIFQEGTWRFDSCEPSTLRRSVQTDGTPVVTIGSGTQSPLVRTNAMIDSWAAGQSSYYSWLSMRCRAEFANHFGPTTAFTLMTANGPDGFTIEDAQEATDTGEVLNALDQGRTHILLPLMLELGLATAGADATTEDEVITWVTVDDRQASLTTRWVEEAGNLYNDACSWVGDDALDDAFDPQPAILVLLGELNDEIDKNQLNFFGRYSLRCRTLENIDSEEDPRLSTISSVYGQLLRDAGVKKPFVTTVISADVERVVVELGENPTDETVIAFAFEDDTWRLDSCSPQEQQ